jgi:NAD(P)-dependent dehydrogenase (short-subunit alcohol dehydrogenase family)
MKLAVITGGASGIGRATTIRLQKLGYVVLVIDVDSAQGLKLVEELGSKVHFFQWDVRKSMKELFQRIKTEYGTIDVLICSAGVTSRQPMTAMAKSEIDRVIEINLTALIECTHLALQYVSKGGSVVHLSSMSGLIPFTLDPVYTATKFGVP